MILDRLEAAAQYARLHPGFDAAFDLLRSSPFEDLGPGRHEVMGDSLFLIIDQVQGKGREAAFRVGSKEGLDCGCVVARFGLLPTLELDLDFGACRNGRAREIEIVEER